ncbi:uncharacterized protein LOC134801950 [Cydia splendana]|uniref:uncharacterized protein LOC134801950 n=1 Tax=Cydia splendana TaxID=1100963 RepID=UPI0028F46AF8
MQQLSALQTPTRVPMTKHPAAEALLQGFRPNSTATRYTSPDSNDLEPDENQFNGQGGAPQSSISRVFKRRVGGQEDADTDRSGRSTAVRRNQQGTVPNHRE